MAANKFQSARHALWLAGISAAVCVMCALSIVVAEAFMPDNVHGRQGVIWFYRAFGPCFVVWYGTGVWSFSAYRSMRERVAAAEA
jgi:hypothetical protein